LRTQAGDLNIHGIATVMALLVAPLFLIVFVGDNPTLSSTCYSLINIGLLKQHVHVRKWVSPKIRYPTAHVSNVFCPLHQIRHFRHTHTPKIKGPENPTCQLLPMIIKQM